MDIIKLIYTGFQEHGFWYILQLLILLALAGGIAIGFLWIKSLFSSKKRDSNVNVTVNLKDHEHVEDEENTPEHNRKQLMNHSFFRSIQKMINYEIPHLEIKERLRQAIFKDFLLIKFTITQDKIRNFVTNDDLDQMSSEIFHNKLHSLVTEMVQEYEATALKQGIPEVVLIKFNEWHSEKAEVIYNFVNDICDANDWYISNSVKFYSFLNQMVSFLDLTLIDARKTLISLNGDLDNVIYKGITSEKHSEVKS